MCLLSVKSFESSLLSAALMLHEFASLSQEVLQISQFLFSSRDGVGVEVSPFDGFLHNFIKDTSPPKNTLRPIIKNSVV